MLRPVLAAASALLMANATLAGTPAPVYVVTLQILSAGVSEDVPLEVATGAGTLKLPTGSSSFVATDVRSFELAGVSVALDDTVTYDGARYPPEGSPVQLLSAPRIATPTGTAVSVRSGSVGGQYFEPGEDGCYRLREVPADAQPGLRLELTVEPVTGGPAPRVSVAHHTEVTTLSGRAPLPGVTLDVGRPETSTASFSGNATMKLGTWNLLGMFRAAAAAGGDQGVLLVLVKVEEPPPTR